MSKKFLYLFKEGHDAFGGDQTTMKNTLGGKGAGLAEMTHAGMPAPAAGQSTAQNGAASAFARLHRARNPYTNPYFLSSSVICRK